MCLAKMMMLNEGDLGSGFGGVSEVFFLLWENLSEI